MNDIRMDEESSLEALEDLMEFEDGFTSGPEREDEEPDQESLALFEGDSGTLFPDQRRCLHLLLKQRYISADGQPGEWAVLLRNEELIRSRLHDLFLELRVDRERKIAFKRQVTDETGEKLPSLLSNARFTKEQTILLVMLRRKRYAERQKGFEEVYVDREEMLREVEQLRPTTLTNLSAAMRYTKRAIEMLESADVLLKTPDPDRFMISPIVEVVLPVERLQMLLDWLTGENRALVGEETPTDGEDATTDDLLTELEENA